MTGPVPGSGLVTGGGSHDLGPQLEPQLRSACDGKLTDIRWFRTDWQRGGAATAFATADAPGKGPIAVVIKLPVGPREYRFLTGLSGTAAPTPRVVFHAMELAGYDLAWVVMERLPGNPVGAHLHKDVFAKLADAVARFQAASGALWPVDAADRDSGFNWHALLDKARESVRANHLKDEQQWTDALKSVQRALPGLLKAWDGRIVETWCHGDLQPANAMMRPPGSLWGEPGTVLLDFAEVHPGHWVEDAVYLERQFWGRPEVLDGVKPVSLLAKARKALGLDCSDDYAMLANVRRLLMAAVAPAFLHREGNRRYFEGAREMMERQLAAWTSRA